ncbi:MAG: methyltransferase domain-containing protein [Ferruginibacter sp.]
MNLKKKFKNISQHIKYKGLSVFLISKLYDRSQKNKLKKLGINHAPVTGDVSLIRSKALNNDAEENMPSSFYEFMEGLKKTGLKKTDVALLDVGCGEGRILNFGMLLHFKRVAGIDLADEALKNAIENCAKMKRLGFDTPYTVEHADAALYTIPENINLIYLFNPFREKTMEAFMDNVIGQINNRQSEMHVIYCVPVWRKVFDRYPECTKIYEGYNQDKTDAYISVFKITPKKK